MTDYEEYLGFSFDYDEQKALVRCICGLDLEVFSNYRERCSCGRYYRLETKMYVEWDPNVVNSEQALDDENEFVDLSIEEEGDKY